MTARWTGIELASAALVVIAMASAADLWGAALLSLFLGVLLALAMIDLEHRRLPNAIVYPSLLIAAGLITVARFAGSALDPIDALLGGCAFGGGLFLVHLLSGGGMGMGDVKVGALIGLVVGAVDLRAVGVAAGAAIAFGGIAGLVALARGADRRSAIPFGPMLALGALVGVVWGAPLADAYLGLFR